MMKAGSLLCLLAVCLLHNASAFVSPHGFTSNIVQRSSGRAPTTRATSAIVLKSASSDEAVARYKNFIGQQRFDNIENADRKAKTVFDEICNVYGEDNAVEMVKSVPNCLSYNSSIFRETFEAFCENFDPEDTKGMVTRNPNLLAVRPRGFGGAENAKGDTMTMSYIIAYTRPLGPVLLGGLFLVLAIPFVELATGIPRGQFISTILGS